MFKEKVGLSGGFGNLYICFTVKPNIETALVIRHTAKVFLQKICESNLEEILIVLNEAVSNCIVHARSEYSVAIKLSEYEDILHVEMVISDRSGRFFDGGKFQPPEPGSTEGKMGILTMRALVDDIKWYGRNGTTVKMYKKCQYSPHNNLAKSLYAI